ncbi:hypothetical protein JW756_05915 [Candidatus Woesearchaeota archaeon]|nr:hypothetical protein [Candidatus Woesearchaeota archaeon]
MKAIISEQVSIINLFSQELNRELTINQIAKLIKKSYAFTNKYTHELIKEGVLAKKNIGSAILCSLNMKSEQAIGLLILDSIQQKTRFLDKLSENKKEILTEFSASPDSQGIHTAYIDTENNKITIICEDNQANQDKFKQIKQALEDFKVQSQTKAEFAAAIRKSILKQTIVLKNHEAYWREISRMI